MANATIYGVVFTVLFIGLFAGAIGGFMLHGAQKTGFAMDTEYSNLFYDYNQSYTALSENNQILEGGQVNEAGFDTAIFVSSIPTTIQMARQSFTLSSRIINDINVIIPLDIVVLSFLVLIILTAFTAAFLALIFKQKT